MGKCFYCHQETTNPLPLTVNETSLVCCSAVCADKTLAFFQFFNRFKIVFIAGLCVSVALMFLSILPFIASSLLIGKIMMCVGWGLLGLIICIFPFATPQSFELFGIKKTLWIVRILGIIMLAATPLFAFLAK